MADGAFTEKVRAIIVARARGRCEVCGARVGSGAQIHHRQPRGMGGTSQAGKGKASNGLWVHPMCHDRIEMYRERGLSRGWLVKQRDDPAVVPVKLWDGWFLLDDAGGITKVDRSV